MISIKFWIYYPFAILAVAAIVAFACIDEFLEKLRNRRTL